MKLVFDARALEDIASIGAWWRDNRPAAPDLFDDEFAAALGRIRTAPGSVAVYRMSRSGQRVRRVLMPKTNHIYFVHDAAAAVVRVVALWGAVKRSGPPLP